MKQLKRAAALLLVLALALTMTGCGSFEQRMLRAASKMEKLESWHVDADVTVVVDVSAMGQSVPMKIDMTGSTDARREPLQTASVMRVEAMGQSTELLSYIFSGEEQGSFDSYLSNDGGATWEHAVVSASDMADLSTISSAAWPKDFLVESAKSFSEVGKETVNGSQATRFDGVVDAQAVGKAVLDSGVLDSLGDRVPFDFSKVFEELRGSIPVSLWLDDRSGLLVCYEMDLTDVLASLWDSLIAQLLEQEDLGDVGDLSELGLDLALKQMKLRATLSDFNAVGEIVLPETAQAA